MTDPTLRNKIGYWTFGLLSTFCILACSTLAVACYKPEWIFYGNDLP